MVKKDSVKYLNVFKRIMLMVVVLVTFVAVAIPLKASETSHNVGNNNVTCDKNGGVYHISGSTTSNNITVDGEDIVIYLEGVNINLTDNGYKKKAAINIKGSSTVTIYLVGENTLKGGIKSGIINDDGYAGIAVAKNAKVTILGNGSLNVTGGDGDNGAAGIGGNAKSECGKIVIGGGGYNPKINAKGTYGGAGIGGGYNADSVKGIVINSGTITATGGSQAAGIGGGREGYVKGITINGGTITATGGKYGAGIGAGNAVGLGDGGDISGITIKGGTITATGGEGAAGIGGGEESEVKNIKVEQEDAHLDITAKGGESGAGIGSGNADITYIEINLNGGKILAKGGIEGAGIGAGNGEFNSIRIIGHGDIEAVGYKNGCGIGSSGGNDGGSITIKGKSNPYDADKDDKDETKGVYLLNIKATARWNEKISDNNSCSAAAIGSSEAGCGNIYISNANIVIESYGYASGIGSGKRSGADFSDGMNITIYNCYIKDNYGSTRHGAGIGAGFDTRVNNITISYSTYKGGNIGGSDSTNDQRSKNTIESIVIEYSDIEASARRRLYTTDVMGGKAAIGTGALGKMGSIKIVGSKIIAHSEIGAGIGTGGYADVIMIKQTGGECDSIYIDSSIVDAKGGYGGAGIGGGWGTYVGKIELVNCPEIKAIGSHKGVANKDTEEEYEKCIGGAGIGGGGREGCGDIIITNCKVEAKGDYWSAGIGASGSTTISAGIWDIKCGSITINLSDVTATGGFGGAGIGTGKRTQFYDGAEIKITDSTVKATGGEKGAGIGAGSDGINYDMDLTIGDNSTNSRGGEANIPITIEGKSKVEATGGYGAAGIGGGYEGGASEVHIDLFDTVYRDGKWEYYVEAYGGKGAAGIGAGGVYEAEKNITPQKGQDLGKICITGGYVKAVGGDDYGMGAGAGIGGGARGGRLLGFYVSGGYVEATAGRANDSKKKTNADIGSGGDDIKASEKDANFQISGGTVIGSLSPEPSKIVISGGSVRCRVNNAVSSTESDAVRVYQTTLQVDKGQYRELEYMRMSRSVYGKKDIFSDDICRVYMYLPESEEYKQTASFEIKDTWHDYYGTTKTDGTGWLKKGFVINITGAELPVVGGEFTRKLDCKDMTAEVEWTVIGSASLVDNAGNKVDTITKSSTDKTITLYGDRTGYYILTVTMDLNSDVYWNAQASKTENIRVSAANIEIVEVSDKVYDGKPIEHPAVKTNSNGKVTYIYEKYVSESSDETVLVEGVPTDAGKYKVWATVDATSKYQGAYSNSVDFVISKRPVVQIVTAKEYGTGASVIINVSGIVDATTNFGKIRLDYVDYQGQPQNITVPVIKYNDGTYKAIAAYTSVVSGEHQITATYVQYDTDNYTSEPVQQTFDKSKTYRELVVGNIGTKYYGDADFDLPVSLESGTETSGDVWSYEVVRHNFDLPEAVSVSDTGVVTIQNAGVSVVKVTVVDTTGVYATAVGYITVNVNPKEVTVTSYAYETGDTSKTPITEIEYGQTENIEYGLIFNTINDTDRENYGKSIVTLEAVPLDENAEAGTHKVEINRVEKEGLLRAVDPFMSRNYKVTYVQGTVEVVKATVTVNVDDVTITYGETPEYTYSCEGLKEWDNASDVFALAGDISIAVDSTLTGGKDLTELTPGQYADVLRATGVTETDNYIVTYGELGNLTITKHHIEVDVAVDSKVYDGAVAPVDAAVDGILTGTPYDGELVYRYYEITDDGVVKLDGAPVNAGHYAVEVDAKDSEYYTNALGRKPYRILKATPDVDTPKVPDIPMREGLELDDQELPDGWSWIDPDRDLDLGYVSAPALFTPEDTRNYNTVERNVGFTVYDEDDDSGDSDEDDTDEDDSNEDDSEEDSGENDTNEDGEEGGEDNDSEDNEDRDDEGDPREDDIYDEDEDGKNQEDDKDNDGGSEGDKDNEEDEGEGDNNDDKKDEEDDGDGDRDGVDGDDKDLVTGDSTNVMFYVTLLIVAGIASIFMKKRVFFNN